MSAGEEHGRLIDGWYAVHLGLIAEDPSSPEWRQPVDAMNMLFSLMEEGPSEALRLVQGMIDRAEVSEVLLSDIGAGPLELLLDGPGARHADEIAQRARMDGAWAIALSSVWLDPDDVSPEVAAILKPWVRTLQ